MSFSRRDQDVNDDSVAEKLSTVAQEISPIFVWVQRVHRTSVLEVVLQLSDLNKEVRDFVGNQRSRSALTV